MMKKLLVCVIAASAVFGAQSPALAVPGFSWSTSTLLLYPSDCARTVVNSYRNPAPSQPAPSQGPPRIRLPGQASATDIREMPEQVSGVFFGQGFDNDTGVSVWCTPSEIPLCSQTASSLIILAVSDRGSGIAQATVNRLRAQIGEPRLIDCN